MTDYEPDSPKMTADWTPTTWAIVIAVGLLILFSVVNSDGKDSRDDRSCGPDAHMEFEWDTNTGRRVPVGCEDD